MVKRKKITHDIVDDFRKIRTRGIGNQTLHIFNKNNHLVSCETKNIIDEKNCITNETLLIIGTICSKLKIHDELNVHSHACMTLSKIKLVYKSNSDN